jgi:hypothetical protein
MQRLSWPVTYDAAVFVLDFHDLYYASEGWPTIDANSFMSAILTVLSQAMLSVLSITRLRWA